MARVELHPDFRYITVSVFAIKSFIFLYFKNYCYYTFYLGKLLFHRFQYCFLIRFFIPYVSCRCCAVWNWPCPLIRGIGRLADNRYGLVCAIFQGVRGSMLILLALQTTLPLAVVFFWLVYFNMGIINSPHMTLMNREIPSKHRSAMLSIGSFVNYSGS